MVYWKYIFLIVLFSNTVVKATNVIYKIVKGNLLESWQLNVTLFARELRGMILYCIDSEHNKLSVRVTIGINDKRYLRLSYNNVFIRPPLMQSCGCDPCHEKMMNLYLELRSGIISVVCNKFGQDSLTKSDIKDNIPQSVLEIMKNNTNSIFLGMGNVDNTENLVGCLNSFNFNKTEMKFKERRNEFLSSCKLKCYDHMCNGGKCGSAYPIGPFCDCSTVAQNGRYCNRTLKEYSQSDKIAFQRKSILKPVQYKLSWKQYSNRTYCLMELLHGSGHVTFIINEDYLMKNLEVIAGIGSDYINFINVNLTNTHLAIKILEKTFVIELPLFERYKINIGFSEMKAPCQPFVGKYDFNYNSSQLNRISVSFLDSAKINVKWIILPLVFVVLIICGIVLALFIRRRMKKNVNVIDEDETMKLDENKPTEPLNVQSENV